MKLSCYLLRESATPSTCLRDTEAEVSYFVRRDGTWGEQESLTALQGVDAAAVLYRTTAQSPSPWQAMVDRWDEETRGAGSDFALQDRQDRGALFFFKDAKDQRWLVWSFGRAFRYLLGSRLEPRFGVTCALNELSSGERDVALRKLQVRRSAGVNQMVGRSTFEDAPVSAFELDEVWDAIRSVGGRNPDGGSVYGSLSLVRSRALDSPDELQALSEESYELFRQDNYRTEFSFLDHYIPVTDLAVESSLDAALSTLIAADPAVASFAYPATVASFGSREHVVEVLFPHELLGNGRVELSLAVILASPKFTAAGVVDLNVDLRFAGEGEVLAKHPLKECLVAQFEYDGATYALAEGVYYEVDINFLGEVDQFIQGKTGVLDGAPVYPGGISEDQWLDLASADGVYLKVHPDKFNPPVTGSVELADLVAADARLLHVKRGAGAPEAGAVARQIVSACEALVAYPDAIEWLRQRCKGSPEIQGLITDVGSRLPIDVVILGHGGDVQRMSLFAKLELRRAMKYLEARSFDTAVYFMPTTL